MSTEDQNPATPEAQPQQPATPSQTPAESAKGRGILQKIGQMSEIKAGQVAAALAGLAIGAAGMNGGIKVVKTIQSYVGSTATPDTLGTRPQLLQETTKTTSEETQENASAHPSFQGTIDDQVRILSSAQKTAYYLDDNFRIVGEFPYDFIRPPKAKKESKKAYKARVAVASNEWHAENRKKLAAKGITIDLANNKPRVQVSPDPGFADRIKTKASPLIDRVYPNYRDAFAETETSKYFVNDEVRQEFLQTCIYGQATVESRWDEDAASSRECYGLWQMQANKRNGESFSGNSVDLLATNKGTLEKDLTFRLSGRTSQSYLRPLLHSPEASSSMAPFNYDAYLKRIKGTLQEFKTKFPFESEESFQKKFVIPMLYCSYISGGGGVNRLLKAFMEKEGENAAKNFDENNFAWEVILWFYTYDNGTEGTGAFGKDSVQYAMKIFAHAKVIKPVLQGEVHQDAKAKRPSLYPYKFNQTAPYRSAQSKLLAQAKAEGTGVLGDDIDALVKAGKLVKVDAKNEHFAVAGELAKRPYLIPHALYLLRLVAEDFYKKSDGYKLVISDLYRTDADQRALNAPVKVVKRNKRGKKITKLLAKNPVATTGISTHQFGNTFDITKTRVITPQGETKWTEEFAPMLREILVAHQASGAMMALEEKVAFHNMATAPIFGEIPQN
ncbi:hypothetical protein COY05_02455 [Candidatus Peregrinibacteria bacterium CG_4_10_14_0_2_um_filter_38_24]|nr:MAG: hypothetical protein COY05_02455 [Candidatus Peregrinibacteria bacterium CG_4_10_14_0_2_um_filter_38_24]